MQGFAEDAMYVCIAPALNSRLDGQDQQGY